MTEPRAKVDIDIDPVMTAVIANRLDAVIREMTNALLRAARSAVINTARDFSCAICTADSRLLSSAEGLPIHIFGSQLQCRHLLDARGDDIREGDCYLHNDPYTGNSHPADHTFLVPVFVDGEHLFTTVAKAHQADIGNAAPTTYNPAARDVYEEGSLIFPSVLVQRDYETIEDVVRMCRSRIRVPDQWYGDFLAGIGSARVAEYRLKELCRKYGIDTIKVFIDHWFDYSEQMMVDAIAKLPKARIANEGAHDPFLPPLPDGLDIKLEIVIDPDEGWIDVDLRDNPDCVDCGINLSQACTSAAVLAGIMNTIENGVPKNSGSFSRIRLHLREGSAVGIPKFPHSCSAATTNLAARLVNCSQSAFARLGDGRGLAEGGIGSNVTKAVLSGVDHRFGQRAYVNQIIMGGNGGPGTPVCDGWVTYNIPIDSGLMYRDSVEIAELKHPIQFDHVKLGIGTGGAGRFRGAPGSDVCYGPKQHAVTAIYHGDGHVNAPKGVLGGHDGVCCSAWKISPNGEREKLPSVSGVTIAKGEKLHGTDSSGGGYGNPLERDPARVLNDVLEKWETRARAHDVYGVVFTGSIDDESLAVDSAATVARRVELAQH